MYLPHLTKNDTVESLNKGHFGIAQFFVHKEGVLFGRSKMYKNHAKDVF